MSSDLVSEEKQRIHDLKHLSVADYRLAMAKWSFKQHTGKYQEYMSSNISNSYTSELRHPRLSLLENI